METDINNTTTQVDEQPKTTISEEVSNICDLLVAKVDDENNDKKDENNENESNAVGDFVNNDNDNYFKTSHPIMDESNNSQEKENNDENNNNQNIADAQNSVNANLGDLTGEQTESNNQGENEQEEKGKLQSQLENQINDILNSVTDNETPPLESIINNQTNNLLNADLVDISTETEHSDKRTKSEDNKTFQTSIDLSNVSNNTDQESGEPREYSDYELQEALDAMIKKRSLPEKPMRPSLIAYARRICAEKLMREEYDDAIEIDLAVDIMFTSLEEDKKSSHRNTQNEGLNKRLQLTRQKKSEAEKCWNDKIEEQKKLNEAKYTELKKTHQEEKEAFIQEWNDPKTINMYSKPSAKLFQLRSQQKCLALVHDFEGAKIIKSEADLLEKRETADNLKKATRSMKKQYQQLLDRHEREESILSDTSKAAIDKLELDKSKEICSIEATETVLLQKIAMNTPKPRMWDATKSLTKKISSPTVIVPNVRSNSKAKTLANSIMTNRTKTALNSYRVAPASQKLQLKMVDITKSIHDVEISQKIRPRTTMQ